MREYHRPLKSGEMLRVRLIEPPLGGYEDKVGCWWTDVREELLRGDFAQWLFTPYFVGELDGRVVASMTYYTAVEARDVGVVEFVSTDVDHRGKGVASAVMQVLLERFREDEGLALYLCTTNPIAGRLYEKHGFRYCVGDGMRYLSPDEVDFDQTYLSFCGPAQVRPSTWGDLARFAVLYNSSEPRWLVKDYPRRVFRDTRFESHFIRMMRGAEDAKGTVLALENPRKRVVGAVALTEVDSFYEQHIKTLSFRICPAYLHQTEELLLAAIQKARDLSTEILQVHIAACDEEQQRLVKTVGFEPEARLRGYLRDGDEREDLLIYTLRLPEVKQLVRERGDYYGGRQEWQAVRLSSPDYRSSDMI